MSSTPMRILHYLPSLDPTRGGPVRAVTDLAKGLASRGHTVTLAATSLGELPEGGSNGFQVVRIEGKEVIEKPFSSPQRVRARALLDAHDIVHVHGAWSTSNLTFARHARRTGKPYLVSPRGMLDDWSMAQKRFKKRVYMVLAGRTMFERAAAVHCTAEGELRQSGKWFPKGHGVVLPNFLDLNPFRNAPGPAEALATEEAGLKRGRARQFRRLLPRRFRCGRRRVFASGSLSRLHRS